MAKLVDVFGVDFLVGPENELSPDTQGVAAQGDWRARIDQASMMARLEGGLAFGATGLAYLELDLPIVVRGADYALADFARKQFLAARLLVVADRTQPLPATPAHIELDSLVLESAQPDLAVVGGKLQVWATPVARPFRRLPFAFLPAQGHFVIDLGRAAASLAAGCLQLQTFCGDRRDTFVRAHPSLPVVARIGGGGLPPVTLIFRGDASGLPLHVERMDDAFVAGVLAESFELHARFRAHKLESLALAGPHARLLTSTLTTSANKMAELQMDRPLALAVRDSGGMSVSGFLIFPHQPCAFRIADDAGGRIHGAIDSAVFERLSRGQLRCEVRRRRETNLPANINADLLFEFALVWLAFGGGTVMSSTRPGVSFSGLAPDQTATGDASLWSFRGETAAIPLLPRECIAAAGAASAAAHFKELNEAMSGFRMQLPEARHETALRVLPEEDAAVFLDRAYVASRQASRARALLETGEHPIAAVPHRVQFVYGPITISAEMSPKPEPGDPARPPDYVIIWDSPDDIICIDQCKGGEPNFRLGRDDKFRIASKPRPAPDNGGKRLPFALIKLNPDLTMGELFELVDQRRKASEPELDLSFPTPFEGDIGLEKGLPLRIQRAGWTGAILFNCDLDVSGFKILASLIGDTPGLISLKYVAVTPEAGDGRFSVSGAAWWRNNTLDAPPPGYQDGSNEEARFRSESVQVAWDDTRLTQFRYKGRATFPSVFGRRRPQGPTVLDVLGSVNEDTQEIQFIGQLDKELEIFQREDGPIRSVRVRRAEIRDTKGKVSLDLDGGIKLGDAEFDGGGDGGVLDWLRGLARSVDFGRLGIDLDIPLTPDAWRSLSFSYPSLKFDLDDLHFNFFGMENLDLKLFSLGVEWNKGDFDWGRFIVLSDAEIGKSFLLGLRFDFSGLPDIAFGGLKRLQFDLQLGIGLDRGDWTDSVRAAISAVNFSPFRLGLLRFLEISADTVELTAVDIDWDGAGNKSIPVIAVQNAAVKIVGYELFKNLSIAAFTIPDGRRGFFASWLNDDPKENRWLDIKWAIIAHRAFLPEAFAKDIVALDRPYDYPGEEFKDALSAHVSNRDFIPRRPGAAGIDEWTFAASVSVLAGGLTGRFLVQDKKYYGLVLAGKWLEDWFGYKVAVSALYIRRERAAEDSFLIQVRIPGVDVGSIRFMGGVIALEIAVNGGFMLDAGFPWLQDGRPRAWDRTFGAIMTPFQGSGGFYLARRSTVTKAGDGVEIISAGYAVQGGLGATFGGGIFTVWVRAGVYSVFEGEAHVRLANNTFELQRLVVTGAVGILVEGAGELRFWIISATIHVIAQAEARATIDMDLMGTEPVEVRLAFELSATASASACIGSGWFKVCKGISARVSMPFYQTMRIGG